MSEPALHTRPTDFGVVLPKDVQTHVWDEHNGLPLVIKPASGSPDLGAWLRDNRDVVLELRRKYGALLFRDFDVPAATDFEAAAKTIDPDLKDRYLGISPRRKLTDYVFTSVELPPHYPIPQHAEMSFYHDKAPRSLFFWCDTAPASGGATPVTDLRRVYRALDPEVRERFETKGVRHIRGYSGLDRRFNLDIFQFKRWDEVFDTRDKEKVEAICREVGDEVHWGSDGRLTLYSTHPGYLDHPETGERAWYNHIQVMHLAATPHELARQGRHLRRPRLLAYAGLLKAYATAKQRLTPIDRQTWHATHADGTEIPADDVRHVCDVIWAHTSVFQWRPGDVLAIDNRAAAHGRTPFSGDRLIGVAWA